MDLRQNLLELAVQYRLSPQKTCLLLKEAQLGAEPEQLSVWFPRGVAMLAAALVGLGMVMWVAANWESWGRLIHFTLLQALVLAAGLGAAFRPAARVPLGLLALLGIGALFAYFGQTYQTGADPWQLFALWAVMALPLCWVCRSDALWCPWTLVATTAIGLWIHTYSGHQWRVEPDLLRVHLLGWIATLAVVCLLNPGLRRFTGSGAWGFRTTIALMVITLTTTALAGLFHSTVLPHFFLGLALLTAMSAVLCLPLLFDIFALSAVALGLNALLVCGMVHWCLDDLSRNDWVGSLLLVGLCAAALLAVSVHGIVKIAHHQTEAASFRGEIE